ncbi:histidine phosphatase family protein [Paucibacter sp. PLA-PC-4]|uniref:histidine phosphatase family protein n=1 Tax=Paucibacter sp. PLA-PC-4 TaxID=2993655 RepID=UPI00224991E4|nr:histidine phosphatase family protein [Paucibacter sp. PLA-PC-4]MCX2863097.1 histidine phosphatase family protein [Paucibacter sp. PLA-PC-4]
MSEDQRVWAWRHPRPEGAAGRCIGASTDLPVHWRRAKRLARRIQATARRERLPHCIHSSPLRRCRDVGAWLRRWGWTHRVDAALLELDFGNWEGKTWHAIGRAEVDAWCADFSAYAPGGGEALNALLARAGEWSVHKPALVVSHGGWMLARRWVSQARPPPASAADWPTAPRYGELWRL